MPKIKVNDNYFYYEQHGQGEALVLIAGYAADHLSFQYIVPALAKKFKVILFDNRGVGLSDTPAAPYTLSAMADDVAGLLDCLGVTKAHILGHSMGGKIALKLALEHVARVDKLFIVGSRAKALSFPLQPLVKSYLKMLDEGVSQSTITENFLPWLYASDFFLDEVRVASELERLIQQASRVSDMARAGQQAANSENLETQLEKVQAKTLVITGNDDVLVLPQNSILMAERIPNATLVRFDACGHMPPIEKPVELSTQIIDFCNT